MTTSTDIGTLTPSDVIDAAVQVWALPGGVTSEYYAATFSDDTPDGLYCVDPASKVGEAFCAIGGIEHAIWKLTGSGIGDVRVVLAYDHGPKDPPTDRRSLFIASMAALNDAALELYDMSAEDALFEADDPAEAQKIMLNIAARAQINLAS